MRAAWVGAHRRGRIELVVVLLISASSASSDLAYAQPLDDTEPEDKISEDEEIIDRIDFEGLKRVEEEAVRLVMTSRRGRKLDQATITEDIKAIYGLGYFSDVQVFRESVGTRRVRLVFELKEKPAVRRVDILGNDEVSSEDIKEVVDIRPFTILSESKVKRNVQKIKDLYVEKGFYLAEVTQEIVVLGPTEVVVTFRIDENAKVEVRRLRLIGNHSLPTETLTQGLATKEGGLLSFLSDEGTYRSEAFNIDLLKISSHYFDNGYLNVKVDNADLELSPDRRYLYITVRIIEGEQFSVGKIDFSGDLLDTKEELFSKIKLKDGDIFNRTLLGQDLLALKTRYEDEGYAYANITPVTAIDQTKRTIDLTYDVEKGQKVYYERINMVGNSKTRDKVIRRELRIYEGDLTSASARELSRRRVTQLGYFEKVDIKTRKGSRDDLQIVDIEIKERATGTFQVGAGFSSAENFIFTAQVSQENFLGRGQSVALSAQISSLRQLFQLRFSEPYFLDSLWTFSFNAFNTETQFRNFLRSSTGGDVTFGHPITDEIRVFLTYTLEFVESRGADGLIAQPAFAALNNTGRISSLRGSISYDTRNNRLFPTDGQFHTASLEVSDQVFGASETREFQKFRIFSRFYQDLVFGLVAKLAGRIGYINSGSEIGLSPSEKFVMGGINTVRGYLPFTIGPERRATGNNRGIELYDPYSRTTTFVEGGNKEFLMNLEIEFPIFEEVQIKGVVFLDAGNVYAEEENLFYIGGRSRD